MKMMIKNHTRLRPCHRKGMLSSLAYGALWHNDESNSTHLYKLQPLRLQLVGATVLVWNDNELFISIKMDIWAVKKMLVSKGCIVSTISFGRE